MKPYITPVATTAAALLIAACGGGSSSPSSSSSAQTKTVDAKQVQSVGTVLVDRMGNVLYRPDQEADGKVRCTGACTSIWRPLQPGGGRPTAASGIAGVGVITRPDGTRQVTVARKPVYTFSQDTPGTVKGNGVADAFGGTQFTWHAILTDGTTAGPSGGGGRVPGY
jgi:predicted lipoprotein with Yx(FWY)xxD motif